MFVSKLKIPQAPKHSTVPNAKSLYKKKLYARFFFFIFLRFIGVHIMGPFDYSETEGKVQTFRYTYFSMMLDC
jgi:hypothetical protein